ncbi:hypothetical protein BDR03DRAFT_1017063 [Suillus americanus]|nr:hypothetical protein BDR03DRAFT_1017063 [Suillus americanus]
MIDDFTTPFNPDAAPATNDLNYHEVLQNIGCAYLEEYDLIVCRHLEDGMICEYGIPLIELSNHCYTTRKASGTAHSKHAVPVFQHSGTSLYKQTIKDYYQKILKVFPNVILTHAELRAVRPLANQCGPIRHIRAPVDGHKCKLCDFSWATKTNRSFLTHWNLYHGTDSSTPMQERSVKTKLQTFSQDRSRYLYFPVREEVGKKKSASIQDAAGTSILAAQLRRLAPAGHAPRKLAMKAVLPFFQQIGAVDHISPYKESMLSELVALPAKGEKHLKKLQKAVIFRIEKLCNQVSKANLANRQRLVTPRSGEKSMQQLFSAPIVQHTRIAYASEEVRLLCFVLRCISNKVYTVLPNGTQPTAPITHDQYHVSLTTAQLDQFIVLQKKLASRQTNSEHLIGTLNDVLETLYMPSNALEMFRDHYINPVAAFICLRAIHPDGGFINPENIAYTTVRTQFDIRLFLLDFLERQFAGYMDSDVTHLEGTVELQVEKGKKDVRSSILKWGLQNPGEDFLEYCQRILDHWATEMKNTPLAFVREWIKSLSAIVRKTPAKAIATWCQRDGDLSIRLLKYEVSIDSYRAAVKSTLEECILHIRSKVLFDLDLPKSCFQLPNDSNPRDETTRGYGIFSFATNSDSDDFGDSGSRAASSLLLHALSKRGNLCQWDKTSNSLS